MGEGRGESVNTSPGAMTGLSSGAVSRRLPRLAYRTIAGIREYTARTMMYSNSELPQGLWARADD
jgi:hypothetical protein